MAFPAVATAVFGIYAYVMYWYSVPGAGFLAEGKQDVVAWIGDLSVALPATATVLYLSMCYFGPKIMAKREAFEPKGFMLVYNAYQTVFNIITVAIFRLSRLVQRRPAALIDDELAVKFFRFLFPPLSRPRNAPPRRHRGVTTTDVELRFHMVWTLERDS